MLIEEISESERYTPDNAEGTSLEKQISVNCNNIHDSSDDCVNDSEVADCEMMGKGETNSQETIDDKINGK